MLNAADGQGGYYGRGDTLDFPCDANTPGVDMVSGFSANGLKAYMSGEEMQSTDPDKKETPYDGMRKQRWSGMGTTLL